LDRLLILGATNWIDDTARPNNPVRYFVRPVVDERELATSGSFTLPANAPVRPYLSVPLQTPAGYTPNDASVGDLDGDGEYDIVLHQAGRGKDNSQNGETDPPILEGLKLDGVRPSVVLARGYYTRTVLAAWNFRDGKLSHRWTFDSSTPGNGKYAGQGNHSLSVGDVDGDGRDEVVYGKMCVDDNGQGLYSTRIGHSDAGHLCDLGPSRPGLEVFSIQESFGDAGAHMFDARTGEILWKKASVKAGDDGEGPGRGLSLDIDPR
jgi:hypothetical protein